MISEETRKKMSESRKGKASPNKGKKLSEEAKEKLSLKSKGKHWYTNGIKEVFALECPEGFVKGRAKSLKEKMKGNSNGIHVSPVKGKRLPEEWRNNVIKAAKNRVLTEEQRKNLSIKAKEVWNNRELKEKQSKHSLQMWNNFTEEEYNSIVQKHKDYWTEEKKQEQSIKSRQLMKEGKIGNCNGKNHSKAEEEIVAYIKSFYNKEVIVGYRDADSLYELDVFVPEQNLAFEYNGVYYHSCNTEKGQIDKSYHKKKSRYFANKGIRVVMIWEHEWYNEKDKCLKFIKQCFRLRKKGYKEYSIREISKEEAKVFLDDNHFYGDAPSTIRLGLFTKDGLVAVSTFQNNKKGYEWKRFCQLPVIIEGKSIPVLLFEYFRDNYMKPGDILLDFQQCDKFPLLDYSSSKMGFVKKNDSDSIIWVSSNLKKVCHHRFQAEKATSYYGKLKHPTKDWTEDDVAKALGYKYCIFGCGTISWVYKKVVL